MTEQLISLETAKLAKEKGFVQNPYEIPYSYRYKFTDNTGCVLSHSLFNPSSNICTAPTQSLLQKWLREKYDIDIIINTYRNQNQKYYKYFISEKSKNVIKSEEYYNTYEDALEIGLQEALKLIK